mmetsp:Transcript_269/g.408  ORF Transcript_269/g.408 Transcript_269/m.408 type:complete len:213 (+) Transcript_269:1165-1803(+)
MSCAVWRVRFQRVGLFGSMPNNRLYSLLCCSIAAWYFGSSLAMLLVDEEDEDAAPRPGLEDASRKILSISLSAPEAYACPSLRFAFQTLWHRCWYAVLFTNGSPSSLPHASKSNPPCSLLFAPREGLEGGENRARRLARVCALSLSSSAMSLSSWSLALWICAGFPNGSLSAPKYIGKNLRRALMLGESSSSSLSASSRPEKRLNTEASFSG